MLSTLRSAISGSPRTSTAPWRRKPRRSRSRSRPHYYLSKIGSIKSIDDFLADTRLFKLRDEGLRARGHGVRQGFRAQGADGGVADSEELCQPARRRPLRRSSRRRSTSPPTATATTSADATQQGVVDRYVRQSLETDAGEENEGVRLALYFERAAPDVKSAYGLLADPALWQVVKTVFGFPDEMANADIDKQAAASAEAPGHRRPQGPGQARPR